MVERNYSSADVAAVANIRPGTFDAWLNRGQLDVGPGPGQGRSRRYDLKTAVHIAIVARLVGIGFAIRDASDAAENSLRAVDRGENFLLIAPPGEASAGGAPTVHAIKCAHASELPQFFPLFPDGPPAVYAVVDLRAIAAEVEARLTERLKAREADA